MGMTGEYNGQDFDGITYMVCRPDNDFFPHLTPLAGLGGGGVGLGKGYGETWRG